MKELTEVNVAQLVTDFKSSIEAIRDSLKTELEGKKPSLPGVTPLSGNAVSVSFKSLSSSKGNSMILSPFTYSVDSQIKKITTLLDELLVRPDGVVRALESIVSTNKLRTPVEDFVFHQAFLDAVSPTLKKAIEAGKELSQVLPDSARRAPKNNG